MDSRKTKTPLLETRPPIPEFSPHRQPSVRRLRVRKNRSRLSAWLLLFILLCILAAIARKLLEHLGW